MKSLFTILALLFCSQEIFAVDAQLFPTRFDWQYIEKTQLDFTHFLLPRKSSLKKKLDSIFSSPSILKNIAALKKAGFTIRYVRPSGLLVAKHRAMPKYLFKLYCAKDDNTGALNALKQRCVGAAYIRNLIHTHNIRHFTVPNKWLYQVRGAKSLYVLVVENMRLVGSEECRMAWKTKITPKHLQELYILLSHGYPSLELIVNIPYTKNGTFACVDTERPKRMFDLQYILKDLSEEMQAYWIKLIAEKQSSSTT